jgi:hypothetical protein
MRKCRRATRATIVAQSLGSFIFASAAFAQAPASQPAVVPHPVIMPQVHIPTPPTAVTVRPAPAITTAPTIKAAPTVHPVPVETVTVPSKTAPTNHPVPVETVTVPSKTSPANHPVPVETVTVPSKTSPANHPVPVETVTVPGKTSPTNHFVPVETVTLPSKTLPTDHPVPIETVTVPTVAPTPTVMLKKIETLVAPSPGAQPTSPEIGVLTINKNAESQLGARPQAPPQESLDKCDFACQQQQQDTQNKEMAARQAAVTQAVADAKVAAAAAAAAQAQAAATKAAQDQKACIAVTLGANHLACMIDVQKANQCVADCKQANQNPVCLAMVYPGQQIGMMTEWVDDDDGHMIQGSATCTISEGGQSVVIAGLCPALNSDGGAQIFDQGKSSPAGKIVNFTVTQPTCVRWPVPVQCPYACNTEWPVNSLLGNGGPGIGGPATAANCTPDINENSLADVTKQCAGGG